MRVSDVMTRTVEWVSRETAADVAWEVMRRDHLHHLPVLEAGRLVGLVSAGDLGGPGGARRRQDHVVGQLMTPFAITATPRTDLRTAARLLRDQSIGCLPVLERGKLVGMITTSDLLTEVARGRAGRRS